MFPPFSLNLWAMINELSILIPVYNDCAVPLVRRLSSQACAVDGLRYEILVVDDGSTDAAMIVRNKAVDGIPRCRYVALPRHGCRAAMRNDMARQARYEWRLMVDARLKVVADDFILRYLGSGARPGDVVCGGVVVDGGECSARLYRENLRFRYEKREERNHSVGARLKEPYKAFRTTNFFHHRSVLERVPYDERIKGYGYEDVMLGKALGEAGVRVLCIDNPVAYTSFEGNAAYLGKMEEALRTLAAFSDELVGYSPLLSALGLVGRLRLGWALRLWHAAAAKAERACLVGRRPSLLVFKLYKLGYLAALLRR